MPDLDLHRQGKGRNGAGVLAVVVTAALALLIGIGAVYELRHQGRNLTLPTISRVLEPLFPPLRPPLPQRQI